MYFVALDMWQDLNCTSPIINLGHFFYIWGNAVSDRLWWENCTATCQIQVIVISIIKI